MSHSAANQGANYAICALPRSGSWLLSLGLEDSGLAGQPRPYLCGLAAGEPAPGQTRLAQLQAATGSARRRHAGRNGVFGLKLESTDLPELMRYVTADGSFRGTESDFLSRLFPHLRYVYLARQDKTHQALSLLRGLHTHRWMTASAVPDESDWTPDMAQVDAIRTVLIEQEEHWETFFTRAGIEPHRVRYEDLGRDESSYRMVIYSVLGYLGITARPPLPPPRLNRQAGRGTEDLAIAYEAWRAAHRDGGAGARPDDVLSQGTLSWVAALPRRAHMMLGDGRLTLDEALTLATRASQDRPAPSLGSQMLRAMSDDDATGAGGTL